MLFISLVNSDAVIFLGVFRPTELLFFRFAVLEDD